MGPDYLPPPSDYIMILNVSLDNHIDIELRDICDSLHTKDNGHSRGIALPSNTNK